MNWLSPLVRDLKKGAAFIIEGQLSYFKHPDTNRESYSNLPILPSL